MTRMTGPDCVVMCNLINTHTHTHTHTRLSTDMCVLCVCVCVVVPFIQDVRLVDAPAGVTQVEGQTRLLHLPSSVFAFVFVAKRIQPSPSLVDREVDFYATMN